MACDIYLQIDSIKGESADSQHQGWIEIDSVSWGVTQPKSASSSTSGGHTAERCELTDISFTKLSDLCTPQLLQFCAGGKTFPKAKIEFMRADGDKPVKYFEVELDNVLIAHVAPSAGAGAVLSESVGLKFSKVKWKYTQQKIAGGSAGNTAGGWDLAANRYA